MKQFLILNGIFFFVFSCILLLLNFVDAENNAIAISPIDARTSSSVSPFSIKEGPPQILLKYGNNTYQGLLRSAIISPGEDVSDNRSAFGDANHSNITTIVPEQTLNISQNEQIQLLVYNSPIPIIKPNSLSVTAYHINGTADKTLSLVVDSKTNKFIVDMNKGEYILLAVATWLPNSNNYLTTSGYVTYVFRVNIF